jgi:hypothetical protein
MLIFEGNRESQIHRRRKDRLRKRMLLPGIVIGNPQSGFLCEKRPSVWIVRDARSQVRILDGLQVPRLFLCAFLASMKCTAIAIPRPVIETSKLKN